ncbi:unnamed protein product [Ceratitis capitata]|uniref:(Mediterranean fruit fly) hypothetical protein n=1 Tax=Ceratitis capitata TaxID=7213 RepID=A0A811U7J0_CERCA|nr:unnamed protein product [Ceratitis capitata]
MAAVIKGTGCVWVSTSAAVIAMATAGYGAALLSECIPTILNAVCDKWRVNSPTQMSQEEEENYMTLLSGG